VKDKDNDKYKNKITCKLENIDTCLDRKEATYITGQSAVDDRSLYISVYRNKPIRYFD